MNSAGHNLEREVLRSMYTGINDEIRGEYAGLTKDERKEIKNLDKEMGVKRGVVYEYDEEYRSCDVAVFLGSWKPDRERTWHKTRTSIKQNATNFVVLETPLLGRAVFEPNAHYRVGINGFLNRDALWGDNVDRPSDRWESLGIKYDGWKYRCKPRHSDNGDKKSGHDVANIDEPLESKNDVEDLGNRPVKPAKKRQM